MTFNIVMALVIFVAIQTWVFTYLGHLTLASAAKNVIERELSDFWSQAMFRRVVKEHNQFPF